MKIIFVLLIERNDCNYDALLMQASHSNLEHLIILICKCFIFSPFVFQSKSKAIQQDLQCMTMYFSALYNKFTLLWPIQFTSI